MKSPMLVFTPHLYKRGGTRGMEMWMGVGSIITLECFTTSVKFAVAIKCNLHVFITSSTQLADVLSMEHRGHQIDSSLES